jgi:hypothetical protein
LAEKRVASPEQKAATAALKYLRAAKREIEATMPVVFDIDYHQALWGINTAVEYIESIRYGLKNGESHDELQCPE